ncbi:RHS repeat-associated core domain-containing protein, partial [Neorhodopirellula lusitana]
SFTNSDQYQPLLDAVPGDYTLTVDGSGDATGAYGFGILNLADADALAFDAPVSSTLSPLNETDAYRFNVGAGDRFFFDVQDNTDMGNAAWRLLDPFGNEIFEQQFSDIDTVTLSAAGSYTLLVEGAYSSQGLGSYTFNVQPVAPVIPQPLTLSTQTGQSFTYDSTFNQLTSSTDELGRQTLFDIDPANGNTRSITQVVDQPGGSDDVVASFTYTANGLVDLVTDPLGRVSDSDYDTLGRLTSVTFAQGTTDEAIRRYEYDMAGNATAVIDENGNRTTFTYDVMNRLITLTEADPDGTGPLVAPVTQFTYDSRGNLLTTTDSQNNRSQSVYDARDRMIKSIDSNDQETEVKYDGAGNVVAIVDSLGRRNQNRYDARNRLIETIDPEGGSTRFTYDADDNLISVTDPVNNKTTFAYDARNRLTIETDPLGSPSVYSYDVANNLVEKTDRNERVTEFSYDDLDRMTSEIWIDGDNTIAFTYDKASNLTSVSDAVSSLTFEHDNRNRVQTADNSGTLDAPNVVVSYEYDDVGNVLSVTDTIDGDVGATTAYLYDALKRMTQITQAGTDVSDKRVDLAYNALGQFASIDRYSDMAATQGVFGTSYVYDTLNRLTSMTHANSSESVAFYDFAYDDVSRITQINDIDGVTDYTYDDRDQLVGANHADEGNPDETYSYDANGNRISSSRHDDGYVTGPGNRLLSDGTYNYEYDKEGNQIRRTEIATGDYREFVWDHRNRLSAVNDRDASDLATQEVTFFYDGLGRRISKAVDTTPQDSADAAITHFVYDREDVILDFVDGDGSGPDGVALNQRYFHGPAIDQVLAQEDGAGTAHWHLTDHLGTVRDLVNKTGVVENHIVYDSFGNVLNQSNPLVNTRYLFTGREYDIELGLFYYRARYYDGAIGRFITQDPIGFSAGDASLYRYVENSVLSTFDPSGKSSLSPTIGVSQGKMFLNVRDAISSISVFESTVRLSSPLDAANLRIEFIEELKRQQGNAKELRMKKCAADFKRLGTSKAKLKALETRLAVEILRLNSLNYAKFLKDIANAGSP